MRLIDINIGETTSLEIVREGYPTIIITGVIKDIVDDTITVEAEPIVIKDKPVKSENCGAKMDGGSSI